MNDAARDVLRKAWLDGIPQAFGVFHTADGAQCGMSVLGYQPSTAYTVRPGMVSSDWMALDAKWEFGDVDWTALLGYKCPLCDAGYAHERMLIPHLNDFHELDFAKIAEVMP